MLIIQGCYKSGKSQGIRSQVREFRRWSGKNIKSLYTNKLTAAAPSPSLQTTLRMKQAAEAARLARPGRCDRLAYQPPMPHPPTRQPARGVLGGGCRDVTGLIRPDTATAPAPRCYLQGLAVLALNMARQGSVVPHVDCPHLWSRHRNCFTLLTCAVLRHCFAMECQEEKLIEMVRVYPVLYDTSDGKYMKTKYKQELWGEIAKELNIADVEEVKSMWKKLRNNHRDALRRQKRMMKSGAAATDIKPWRFQAQMEFLLQYMVNENRETSFTNDDPNSEPQLRGQPETQQAEENQDVENNITGIVDEESQPDTADVERVNSVDLSVKEPTDNLSPPPSRPQKKFKKHEVDTVIVKAIEQREQRATERAKERKKLDEKNSSFR
ncbi:hypothetical protein J6590_043878 [Homalodisca vitripennis]|nr:hypothetical protein J6590_043878 [Homalodisca vitripennis]